MERDPTKRRVKPAQALFDLEDLGESSDDSDFRIEDHCEESDDDDSLHSGSGQENEYSAASDVSSDLSDIEIIEEVTKKPGVNNILSEAQNRRFDPKDALKIMICSICLGDRSDATNEIIECDSCGVTVHEGCYGVQDSDSVCSTDSPCPTTPWFCDACKAGMEAPECELCPNLGGIFKETDVGKWVHLVCALYMPGVAFAEVDKLSNVTLFEMAYSKWGSKACGLCQDQRFARTGVAVGCDAGLCRTYFHVTCGQREGLLSEAHSEEVDHADPFYAHCKLHSDKTLIKKRRRNWLALQLRSEQISKRGRSEDEQQRIRRRLMKYRGKYNNVRLGRPQPWVPTQKMPRLLTTSASACRNLWLKAELSGADTRSWELRQAQVEALSDVHRRWHIQPAFSVEFIGYYLDRNVRVTSMRRQLADLLEENNKLVEEQVFIDKKRNKVLTSNTEELEKGKQLKATLEVYHSLIKHLCSNKKLPNLDTLGIPQLPPQPTQERSLALNSCGLCHGKNDQHLLAKCDTCNKFYHLGCLNPPLTRMPKKNKIMGWQCSECDKNSDISEVEAVDPEAPRRLRPKDNFSDFDGSYLQFDNDDIPLVIVEDDPTPEPSGLLDSSPSVPKTKKRRREKHHRYSPDIDSIRVHKHKHKKNKVQEEQRQSLKICIKSIPHPTGEGSAYVATPSTGLAPKVPTSPPTPPVTTVKITPKKKEDEEMMCVTCNSSGTAANIVRCDECLKGFHFHCLDPPVKKSPKVRGYSWHCANCDPTESE